MTASKCVEKYVKEIEEIRKKYNTQLDEYITQLEYLKSNGGIQSEITNKYKQIRLVIKNENIEETGVDAKIKNCVCKDFVSQTGGKKKQKNKTKKIMLI
tara:strand:+ start:2983 stop:3279 length:297 start_codon:yes stop_codon:yes gene_type:complete